MSGLVTLIQALPEYKNLEEDFLRLHNSLHPHKEDPELTIATTQYERLNASLLENCGSTQKAQRVFDAYRSAYLQFFMQTKKETLTSLQNTQIVQALNLSEFSAALSSSLLSCMKTLLSGHISGALEKKYLGHQIVKRPLFQSPFP